MFNPADVYYTFDQLYGAYDRRVGNSQFSRHHTFEHNERPLIIYRCSWCAVKNTGKHLKDKDKDTHTHTHTRRAR